MSAIVVLSESFEYSAISAMHVYRQHDYLGAVKSTLAIDMAHTYKLKAETQVAGKVSFFMLPYSQRASGLSYTTHMVD